MDVVDALFNGHVELVKDLLPKGSNGGHTSLHLAAFDGNVAFVRKLILDGMDIHIRDNMGNTPMHLASQFGRSEVVRELILFGANVSIKNNYGNTPLHIATSYGYIEVVKILLTNKADVLICDDNDNSAIHYASLYGHVEIIKVLLAYKTEIINVQNNNGCTPLILASLNGKLDAVKLLMDNRADKTINTKHSQTPINLAANDKIKNLINDHEDVPEIKVH